jgi:hypothetical protein
MSLARPVGMYAMFWRQDSEVALFETLTDVEIEMLLEPVGHMVDRCSADDESDEDLAPITDDQILAVWAA